MYQCADYDPEFIAELFSMATLPQLVPSSFAAALPFSRSLTFVSNETLTPLQ
jgi:hypothetical protein